MDRWKYVIVGGGVVAGYAARELANGGLRNGELCIISADTVIPYERPSLSKQYLLGSDGAETLYINPPDFYLHHNITVRLNDTVARLDTKRRTLVTSVKEEIGFSQLLIATGASARVLNAPGWHYRGILYVRDLQDADEVRKWAAQSRCAVVIGGGHLGMELSAVLAQHGISTTLVLREQRVMEHFFTPEMSQFFERIHEQRGIILLRERQVAAFKGSTRVTGVVLDSGEEVQADVVVVAIGVQPNTDFFQDSGLSIDNGIVVNDHLETSVPGVYAAGDVANFPDTVLGGRRRIEHWDNAVKQGEYVAAVWRGNGEPFHHVPYCYSNIFDLAYEFWGHTQGADRIVHRGDLTSGSFSVWWLSGGQLLGAFALGRPETETRLIPLWIESRQKLDAERLANASVPLESAALPE